MRWASVLCVSAAVLSGCGQQPAIPAAAEDIDVLLVNECNRLVLAFDWPGQTNPAGVPPDWRSAEGMSSTRLEVIRCERMATQHHEKEEAWLIIESHDNFRWPPQCVPRPGSTWMMTGIWSSHAAFPATLDWMFSDSPLVVPGEFDGRITWQLDDTVSQVEPLLPTGQERLEPVQESYLLVRDDTVHGVLAHQGMQTATGPWMAQVELEGPFVSAAHPAADGPGPAWVAAGFGGHYELQEPPCGSS